MFIFQLPAIILRLAILWSPFLSIDTTDCSVVHNSRNPANTSNPAIFYKNRFFSVFVRSKVLKSLRASMQDL
jgi:hypothetical protein